MKIYFKNNTVRVKRALWLKSVIYQPKKHIEAHGKTIVLLDKDFLISENHESNLLAFSRSGKYLWGALCADYFVDVEAGRYQLVARSWCGYKMVISHETGVMHNQKCIG